jgi:hypothetical protein
MRSVLKKYRINFKVLAEARLLGDKRRLDIIISNGMKYGFELESNILYARQIEAAVREADAHRHHLRIDKMFLVNFVPQGHLFDEVYELQDFSDIKIIYVVFRDTCHEYTLKFLGGNGEVESHTVPSVHF